METVGSYMWTCRIIKNAAEIISSCPKQTTKEYIHEVWQTSVALSVRIRRNAYPSHANWIAHGDDWQGGYEVSKRAGA